MKITHRKRYGISIVLILIGMSITNPAAALSCLSVADYVQSIVGDESTLIITATVQDKIDTDSYTAEVVRVTDAHQGYIDERVFLYHQKDAMWGYLCNTGPAKTTGASGVYLVTKDAYGIHQVTQRLEATDPIAVSLITTIEEQTIEGGISEITPTDRRSQIITTIKELLGIIARLLNEYHYWK